MLDYLVGPLFMLAIICILVILVNIFNKVVQKITIKKVNIKKGEIFKRGDYEISFKGKFLTVKSKSGIRKCSFDKSSYISQYIDGQTLIIDKGKISLKMKGKTYLLNFE